MLSIEEFIIAVFCCIDDWWQQQYQGKRIRKGGFAPALSESEVMTMEVVAEFLGINIEPKEANRILKTVEISLHAKTCQLAQSSRN